MNQKLFTVLLLCALCAGPAAASISRWFSATYNDLKFTLYRYGHCYEGLQPLTGPNMDEAQFLVQQVKTFLDQATYDHEQLANVTSALDAICKPFDPENRDQTYAVSPFINVTKYANETGKANRCNAIEESMDALYYAFRRAALNHSESLNFSRILFYPNATDRSMNYTVLDLINTSWISSNVPLESVCLITNPIKEYIQMRSANSTDIKREDRPVSSVGLLWDYLNRWLDPILGLQKRLYWEGTNRLGLIQTRISSGVSSLRGGIGSGISNVGQRLFGARSNDTRSNSANWSRPINSTRAKSAPVAGVEMVSGSGSTTPTPFKISTSTSTSVVSSTSRSPPLSSANVTNLI